MSVYTAKAEQNPSASSGFIGTDWSWNVRGPSTVWRVTSVVVISPVSARLVMRSACSRWASVAVMTRSRFRPATSVPGGTNVASNAGLTDWIIGSPFRSSTEAIAFVVCVNSVS